MNRIFRLIWSDKAGFFVAVAEIVNSGKKSSGGSVVGSGGSRFALKGLAVSLMLAFASNAYALPNGGSVTAGGAIITSTATSTTISQSTANAAINWQSFSIGQGEAVRFVQPNSSSIALNRVLGPDTSSILGNLSANGKVFLLNPNGILFGQGAQVNVGGLVASTLNLSDSDFMAGRYQFFGAGSGAILNQGSINADGGYVALLGAQVSNEGQITARLGTVALAAGNAITLDLAGDELLNVTIPQAAVNALVENGGLIQADGGQVLLTAMAAGSLLQNAVNNTGLIQAQTIEDHKGTIKLLGGMQVGTVNVGGTLDASAPNGGDGGFIETSAARVKVQDEVWIITTAARGQTGTWLIDPVDFTIAIAGGDITPATLVTNLASNVTIESSSGSAGTNGNINVNNDVTWNAATTLTLNAYNDVNFNAAVTATTGHLVANAGRDINIGGAITTTNGNITWTAGRDININAAVTTTDGNLTACCGRDINISAAMTTTRGNVLLRAGSDGTAGRIGGSVNFVGAGQYTVTGPGAAVTVDYTPSSYATPTDYAGNFILSGGATLTQHMLVFAQGNDKVYDGNTTATLTFRGNPTLGGVVTLIPGAATFDDKNAASGIGITYNGYTLGGADAGKFALWAPCASAAGAGNTSAEITPALLTGAITAADKVYDSTTVATITGRTLIGVLGADVVAYTGGDASFDTQNVGAGKTVTGVGLGLEGADAGNYTVNSVATTTAAITAAPPVARPVVPPPVAPVVASPDASPDAPSDAPSDAPPDAPAVAPVVAPVVAPPDAPADAPAVAPSVVVPLIVLPVLVQPVTPQIEVSPWAPQVVGLSVLTLPPQLTVAQLTPPPVDPIPIAVSAPVDSTPMMIDVSAPVETVPVIVLQKSAPKSFVPVRRPRKADRN